MSLFARTILIAALLAQSLPALAMNRCIAMPDTSALVMAEIPGEANCSCCGGDGGAAVACPLAEQGYVGCNCLNPQPDQTPPPPKNQAAERWLGSLPVLIAVLLPEPPETPVRWASAVVSHRQSPSSVQSLLCVWRL